MENMQIKRLFPKCFPDEIQRTIRDIAYEEEIDSYRVCRWGKVDKQAFLSTYEEYTQGLITIRDSINYDDVGTYSTSVYEKQRDIKRIYKLIHRPDRNPEAIVIKIKTMPQCGLVQRSSERDGRRNSHIDWWIYEEAQPYKYPYEEVSMK